MVLKALGPLALPRHSRAFASSRFGAVIRVCAYGLCAVDGSGLHTCVVGRRPFERFGRQTERTWW
jgi:hypothetical protein